MTTKQTRAGRVGETRLAALRAKTEAIRAEQAKATVMFTQVEIGQPFAFADVKLAGVFVKVSARFFAREDEPKREIGRASKTRCIIAGA